MTTKTKTTRKTTETAREADRAWLAGQHRDNIRRIAIRFRIANGPGATVEEMRENILARIDGRRRRGELLDVRCPTCRAPVVIDKYQPRTTPEEVEAGRARRHLRCLGAHRHLFPRFVPIDLT